MDSLIEIQNVAKDDYFIRKIGAKQIYQKGPYCRTNKAWECTDVQDFNKYLYIKKGKKVLEIDF